MSETAPDTRSRMHTTDLTPLAERLGLTLSIRVENTFYYGLVNAHKKDLKQQLLILLDALVESMDAHIEDNFAAPTIPFHFHEQRLFANLYQDEDESPWILITKSAPPTPSVPAPSIG